LCVSEQVVYPPEDCFAAVNIRHYVFKVDLIIDSNFIHGKIINSIPGLINLRMRTIKCPKF